MRGPHREETALIVQMLKHTPPWVFVLFFGLCWLGVAQTRAREVPWPRLALLPVAMLALSFGGVWSTFGARPVALAAWAGALLVVVVVGLCLPGPRGAAWSRATRRFTVPGSWVPLAAMLCIFLTKYAVAVARAMGNGAIATPAIVGICLVLGLCSGLFLARALRIARTALTPVAGWGIDGAT